MGQEVNSPKIEVVKNIILRVFYYLEEQYHYTPTCKVKDENTFMESLEIEYKNEIKRRKIRISYTKAKVYNEIKYTFSGTITRIPYAGVEDFFSLSNFLQSIDRDFSTSLVNDFYESKAENILLRIAIALNEHALGIIDGKEWLEVYYPRKD